MGRAACYDGYVKCIQCFGWGNKKETGHLEELGKEENFGSGQGLVVAVVNIIINHLIHKM